MPEPPEIKLPVEVVRMAARRLSVGQTMAEEVLERTLEHLRELGWLVRERPKPGETLGQSVNGSSKLISWPPEMEVPYFDGSPGSYTIAPWSVKLTPQPPVPAERSSSCTKSLRAAGKAYPRTCAVCGLGPCRWPDPTPPTGLHAAELIAGAGIGPPRRRDPRVGDFVFHTPHGLTPAPAFVTAIQETAKFGPYLTLFVMGPTQHGYVHNVPDGSWRFAHETADARITSA